jgi:lipopolysaccharide biosynthesis regulator YciM
VLALGLAALALLLYLSSRLQRRRIEARAYLRGVRYVISDDPDAAIEALSDAARLGSPEAVETYLALGALFRRTGDLPRAIRLHRNMLLRPGLDPARRQEIERELAEDYRRGGLLGEAQAAFRALWEGGDRVAGEGLRDALIDAGRLEDAAGVQRELGGGGDDPVMAHLLAALARSRLPGDAAQARAAARGAVAASPGSGDALLALAEAEGRCGDAAAASAAVAAAFSADPGSALLAWPALEALGDGRAALEFVDSRLAASPADAALHYLRARLLDRAGEPGSALEEAGRALEADATGEVTLMMRDLLRDASRPRPEELARRHDLLVRALLRKARPVRCARCGAEAPVRAWRCRRCGAFESFAAKASRG